MTSRTAPKTPNASLRPSRSLLQRVRRFAREHELFAPGERVLVAVSGGPDSTCLLLTLAALRRSLGIELVVAHFDHRLRGTRASAREERFVRSLAERLALPIVSGAADVRDHAKMNKRSLEQAARELRYGFLAQAAHELRCRSVAVGHTRDDQAETVLLHLIRGSGLAGLAGMAPVAPWPFAIDGKPPRLVRPLLGLTRADTEAACREAGVTPLQDPTNRRREHKRNRIRHELLPLLRRENPRVDEALGRLATSVGADLAYLDQQAAKALARVARPADGGVGISRSALARLPGALASRVVQLAVAEVSTDRASLSARQLSAVLAAAGGPTGARLDLPGGVRADVRRDSVVFTALPDRPRPLPARAVALTVPGCVDLGPWRISAEVVARPRRRPPAADALEAWVDAAAAAGRLTVRRRRPGDRFQPLGMGEPKKLQDFFVDAHVERAERDSVLLVCAKAGVLWVMGQRIADWARVRPGSRRIVRLRAKARPAAVGS